MFWRQVTAFTLPALQLTVSRIPASLPRCGESRVCDHHHTRNGMKNLILDCRSRLHKDEAGQGIVEYMTIIALVAFAATAGMSSLASGVNSAMTKIGSILGVYIK